MNSKLSLTCALGVSLLLGACIVPPSMFERASWGPPPDYWQNQGRYKQGGAPEDPPAAKTTGTEPVEHGVENGIVQDGSGAKAAAQPPLYAWDGGVVEGAPEGQVTMQSGTPRGVETPPSGRAHIVELYQQVLDERDALTEEVENLRKTLEQTNLALDAKTHESEDLSAKLTALQAAHEELQKDNQSIAARLVQAQIRRLEAEKLLLEGRIETERAQAEEAARAAAAQSKPSKRSPTVRTPTEDGHE